MGKEEKTKKKGIDWFKDNMFDAIGRSDLKKKWDKLNIKKEDIEKVDCPKCSGDGYIAEHARDMSCVADKHLGCPARVRCEYCRATGKINQLNKYTMEKEEKPSEAIKRIGDKAELDFLKDFENTKLVVLPSKYIRLLAETNYIKKFLDEIYEHINKPMH